MDLSLEVIHRPVMLNKILCESINFPMLSLVVRMWEDKKLREGDRRSWGVFGSVLV